MGWPRWSIAAGPGDFVPLFVGCIMLFISVPPFLLLLLTPDPGSEVIGRPLLVVFGIGTLLGIGFLVLGLQLCARPGSLAYRIAHGRIFFR